MSNTITLGLGRPASSWQGLTRMDASVQACLKPAFQQSSRHRQHDLGFTPIFDPQRASAPRRWDP